MVTKFRIITGNEPYHIPGAERIPVLLPESENFPFFPTEQVNAVR